LSNGVSHIVVVDRCGWGCPRGPRPSRKVCGGIQHTWGDCQCWDDGTARKCIEGYRVPNKANGYRCVVKPPLSLSERAEQAQAAFVKSVWKPSKRFVQSIPSLPTKAAAFIDDVLIGQGFFNQNTRPIGEAIDLISLKKYAKEPTHRGYNPKIDREYKPGVGLISIAIVMLGLFGGYFLGQTLQRSGDATQAPTCMESQAEAAEPKQAKMSPKAGGYPKVTSAPAQAKKAPTLYRPSCFKVPARGGRAASKSPARGGRATSKSPARGGRAASKSPARTGRAASKSPARAKTAPKQARAASKSPARRSTASAAVPVPVPNRRAVSKSPSRAARASRPVSKSRTRTARTVSKSPARAPKFSPRRTRSRVKKA